MFAADRGQFDGEFWASELNSFSLRGQPELFKERSRDLRRVGEFFCGNKLAGRQRESQIGGMWRRCVHDLKILR
jgi:hypothetical protein